MLLAAYDDFENKLKEKDDTDSNFLYLMNRIYKSQNNNDIGVVYIDDPPPDKIFIVDKFMKWCEKTNKIY